MSRTYAPLSCVLALALLACTAPRSADRAAVLAMPDAAGRAELARVAAAAAGVASVTLRDDAFTASSVLVLERRTPGGPLGQAATGRTLEEPVRLELVLRGSRCLLVRAADGRAWELRESRCVAAR